MSMYQRYLLKKEFWRSNNAYVRHDLRAGGIYAYIQDGGVKVVTAEQTRFFNNFNELDLFIDSLTKLPSENYQFMQVLNRRNTAKLLRKLPM